MNYNPIVRVSGIRGFSGSFSSTLTSDNISVFYVGNMASTSGAWPRILSMSPTAGTIEDYSLSTALAIDRQNGASSLGTWRNNALQSQ